MIEESNSSITMTYVVFQISFELFRGKDGFVKGWERRIERSTYISWPAIGCGFMCFPENNTTAQRWRLTSPKVHTFHIWHRGFGFWQHVHDESVLHRHCSRTFRTHWYTRSCCLRVAFQEWKAHKAHIRYALRNSSSLSPYVFALKFWKKNMRQVVVVLVFFMETWRKEDTSEIYRQERIIRKLKKWAVKYCRTNRQYHFNKRSEWTYSETKALFAICIRLWNTRLALCFW